MTPLSSPKNEAPQVPPLGQPTSTLTAPPRKSSSLLYVVAALVVTIGALVSFFVFGQKDFPPPPVLAVAPVQTLPLPEPASEEVVKAAEPTPEPPKDALPPTLQPQRPADAKRQPRGETKIAALPDSRRKQQEPAAPVAKGRLNLFHCSGPLDIFIDGHKLASTSAKWLAIPIGKHKVHAQSDGTMFPTQEVDVQSANYEVEYDCKQ